MTSFVLSKLDRRRRLLATAVALLGSGLLSASGYGSISDIYGDPTDTGSLAGAFTETGTVTSILSSSVYMGAAENTFVIADGTGSVLAYNILATSYAPVVGQNITFTAYNSPYFGAPELVQSKSGTTFTASLNGVDVAPDPVITISDLNNTVNGSYPVPPLSEALVTLDNVTFTTDPASLGSKLTYTIADSTGTGSLYTYTSDSSVTAAIAASNLLNPTGYGGTYDITGYVDPFSGTLAELYPLSITQVPEPASLGLLVLGGVSLLARRRR